MDLRFINKKNQHQYNFSDVRSLISDRHLEAIIIQEGIIKPFKRNPIFYSAEFDGGMLDSDFNVVMHSLTNRKSPKHFTKRDKQWFFPSAEINSPMKKKDNSSVIYIGALPLHFGHFISEGLSRIWYALQKTDLKLVYIGEQETPYKTVLESLGIDVGRLEYISEPTQYNEVFVPEVSLELHHFVNKEFFSFRENLKKFDNILTERKNIILAKRINNYRDINFDLITALFEQIGFETIYPEELTHEGLVKEIRSAQYIACSSGTSAHNAIFAQDGTNIICLNRSYHAHPFQFMIDLGCWHNTKYIDAYKKFPIINFSVGPFIFQTNKNLYSFFKSEFGMDIHPRKEKRILPIIYHYLSALWQILVTNKLRQFKRIIMR